MTSRILNLTLSAALLASAGCGLSTSTGEDPAVGALFQFAPEAPASYTRVDRMGMPGIATAVITDKDGYNAADPADDANGDFVPQIIDNVTAIHSILDDDLTGAGLAPCAVGDCVGQAAPLVVPDTIKIDATAPAGFPNGRLLGDPVMDVTLAVVLLDLTGPGSCGGSPCAATTFVSIGLNPGANDVPFAPNFPYLAAPN